MAYCGERGIPHSVFLEWDDEDRAKALAWKIEQSLKCPSCGTAQWEWEEDKFAYDPVEEICPGCERKDLVRDDPDYKARPGSYVTLRKR